MLLQFRCLRRSVGAAPDSTGNPHTAYGRKNRHCCKGYPLPAAQQGKNRPNAVGLACSGQPHRAFGSFADFSGLPQGTGEKSAGFMIITSWIRIASSSQTELMKACHLGSAYIDLRRFSRSARSS